MTNNHKTIFIAPLNWGLGHATRVLPLIRRFSADGHNVIIAVHGRARILLESEVPDCTFVDFPEYPIRFPNSRFFITRFMFITLPQMLRAMRQEKKALHDLQKKHQIDLIISDNRFCLFHDTIPAYLISHQLRYILPFPIGKLEWLPEYFNYRYFKKYNEIIIPDETAQKENLTGVLSHGMRFLPDKKLRYAGILADINEPSKSQNEDIDYFIIVSGPEPQRSNLEKLMFQQANQLKGKVIVALGRPERNYKVRQGNALFYAHMNRKQLVEHMSRAKFIIGRPGYTSVMEMAALKKRGLFIPTPGQIEQEYLAGYYEERGWFHCADQKKVQLKNEVEIAMQYEGFPFNLPDTEQNVSRLIEKLIPHTQEK